MTDSPGPRSLARAPFGLLRLAASLRASGAGVKTRIVDWNRALHRVGEERSFKTLVRAHAPAVVGFSAYSFFMPAAMQLARWVRECDEAIPIVLGGAHATSFPGDVGRFHVFDYFVRGEGGPPLAGLLRALVDGEGSPEAVPALTFRRKGAVLRSPDCAPPRSLDEVPPVEWSDLDLANYGDGMIDLSGSLFFENLRGPIVPYKASAGCVHLCNFCERVSGSRLRHHGPGRVVEDVRRLARLFPGAVVELLDEFAHLDRGWFREVLAGLSTIDGAGRPRFICMARADQLDRETIDRMADAGFAMIGCFPESGSARIRELMNKRVDVDALLGNAEYAASRGIVTFGSALVGWPGETEEEFEATCRLAREPCFDLFAFNPLIHFAGTRVGREALPLLGIEPGTPEYFASLLDPTRRSLAAWGVERYPEIVKRGQAITLEKATSAGTTARLESAGLRVVEMERPGDPDSPFVPLGTTGPLTGRPAVEEPGAGTARSGEAGENERLRRRIDELEGRLEETLRSRRALDLVLERIGREFAAPGWRVAGCRLVEEGDGTLRRVRLAVSVEAPGASVELFVEGKGPGKCWLRTRLFNVGYSSPPGPPGEAERLLLRRLVERIVRWEVELLSPPRATDAAAARGTPPGLRP